MFLQRRFQLHVHAPHSCHCNVGIWQCYPLAHFLLVIIQQTHFDSQEISFRKNWLMNDISYVRDLTNSCGNFIMLSDCESKYHKNVPFTT